MKVKALAQWYGSNRMLAEHVGSALEGCVWVGIPFAGGLCELPYIHARTVLVGDLHRHVINLATVVASEELKPRLVDRLRQKLFHPDVLAESQDWCRKVESGIKPAPSLAVDWAAHYFVCCWMTRSGSAGTVNEFKSQLSFRWESGGGDSVVRFRSAIDSLDQWHEKLKTRCTFICCDWRVFFEKCKDLPGHGLYLDPPFFKLGKSYKCRLGIGDVESHEELARALDQFKRMRIVCRFYDTEFVRKIYPGKSWQWTRLDGRKQTNAVAPEVLLVR